MESEVFTLGEMMGRLQPKRAPRPEKVGCRVCGSTELSCHYCQLDMTGGKCTGSGGTPGCGSTMARCHAFGCGAVGRPVGVPA